MSDRPHRAPRRRPGAAVLALLASLAAGGCGPAEPQRPHLLFVAVDTLRADHLGAYGYERGTSPALDRFLARAVIFEDAHASAPWTLASFASMMTSTYSSTHGCWHFECRLGGSFQTLAEILADAGWETAAVVSHVPLGSSFGLAQGFEHYDESLVYSNALSHKVVSAPAVSEKGIAFLKQRAGGERPWFLFLHYFDPHSFYLHHRGITDAFGTREIDRYDGEIALTDRYLAQVLERLERLGLADETVVVFVSDHGEEFHDHGRRGHGKTLYDEVIRVPLAIRAPGFEPARVDTPVRTVDLLPTLLELLGVPAPEIPMAGRSLVPLMRGAALEPAPALVESRLALRMDADLSGIVLGRWKLVVEWPKRRPTRDGGAAADAPPAQPKRVLLFDREADPGETRDVASLYPEVVKELRARLDGEVARAREAARFFAPSERRRLTPDEIRRLRQLGYVEETAPTSD